MIFRILLHSITYYINISIQSDNNLTASIRSVSNFSTVGSINQSESIDIPYQSYEVSILMAPDVTYGSFWDFLGGITGKGTMLILIVLIVFLIWGFMKGLR